MSLVLVEDRRGATSTTYLQVTEEGSGQDDALLLAEDEDLVAGSELHLEGGFQAARQVGRRQGPLQQVGWCPFVGVRHLREHGVVSAHESTLEDEKPWQMGR